MPTTGATNIDVVGRHVLGKDRLDVFGRNVTVFTIYFPWESWDLKTGGNWGSKRTLQKTESNPLPHCLEGPMMLRVCYSPEKLTYRSWKSNGWKTKFPFEMVPFWGDIRSSLGETISEKMPQTEFLPGESPKGPMEGWCGRWDDDVPKRKTVIKGPTSSCGFQA